MSLKDQAKVIGQGILRSVQNLTRTVPSGMSIDDRSRWLRGYDAMQDCKQGNSAQIGQLMSRMRLLCLPRK